MADACLKKFRKKMPNSARRSQLIAKCRKKKGIVRKGKAGASLKKWQGEKWVSVSSSGRITGPCGGKSKSGKTRRCLPKKKAQSLTKAQRAATAKKKEGSKKKVVKNTKKAKVKS